MCHEVLVAFLEVPVHVGVDETEHYSLVAYKSLVVAFAVADGLFVGTAVFHFPEYRTWLPVLVFQLLNGLDPVVWNVHCHTIVEAVAAILEFCCQSRHSAHFLGNGDGIRVHLVDEFVCKCEVADGIVVLMTVEIVAVTTERLAKSVAII